MPDTMHASRCIPQGVRKRIELQDDSASLPLDFLCLHSLAFQKQSQKCFVE